MSARLLLLYTPVSDTSYIYRIAPVPAGGAESLDVANGSTANGTSVQQYASWNGVPQRFTLEPDGANWRIGMTANTAKCIDLKSGGTANGTALVISDCQPGHANQQWIISADAPTGAFFLKNVLSGRCLDVPAGTTASGAMMEIWDCNSQPNQKFNIQAFPAN